MVECVCGVKVGQEQAGAESRHSACAVSFLRSTLVQPAAAAQATLPHTLLPVPAPNQQHPHPPTPTPPSYTHYMSTFSSYLSSYSSGAMNSGVPITLRGADMPFSMVANPRSPILSSPAAPFTNMLSHLRSLVGFVGVFVGVLWCVVGR